MSDSQLNGPARSFEDLIVWQKAHQFVLKVYTLTERFPKSELFGLTSQLRRASVSIAANVAEGFRKTGKADKMRFFNIAQGSADECRYYPILCRDLKYAQPVAESQLLDEVSRLLEAYRAAINRSR
jgi:four helix bundle protein